MKTQAEVRELLAERTGLSKSDADKVIKEYVSIVKECLVEEGKFKLPEIGVLEVRFRAAREGRNPKTKETIQIPETLTVGLSTSKIIKDEVANKVDISKYRK